MKLDDLCAKLAEDAFDETIVLVVMTPAQWGALQDEIVRRQGEWVTDPSITRNALLGVTVEVNDNWVGEPGLLTAADVEKYRGARRRLDPRMDPARRLEL